LATQLEGVGRVVLRHGAPLSFSRGSARTYLACRLDVSGSLLLLYRTARLTVCLLCRRLPAVDPQMNTHLKTVKLTLRNAPAPTSLDALSLRGPSPSIPSH
jgi:hypothetical protein